MAGQSNKTGTTNTVESLKQDIDKQLDSFQNLLKQVVMFQEKMAERASDLMDMVALIEMLVNTSEKRFKQINNSIEVLAHENNDGKKSMDEIVTEFELLKRDINATKHLISQKTQDYTEDVISKVTKEEAEELKMKRKENTSLLAEISIYSSQEEKIMKDLQLHLETLELYKTETMALETNNALIYDKMMSYIKQIDNINHAQNLESTAKVKSKSDSNKK